VERLGSSPEFVVFGVVTEYCVNYAAKGLLARKRRVTVVKDAIETLDPKVGAKTISDLQNLGARLITTDEALAKVHR
jgi:nicotinamidase/pyrazinamidase